MGIRLTRGLALLDTLGLKYGTKVFDGTGAPTDGVAGTGVGFAGPGSLYVDVTNKKIYQNTNTKASPTWNGVGEVAAGEITLAEGNMLVGNAAGVAAALSAKTTGRILVGDGTTVASVALSQDATLAASGALTIANSAITNAKIADGTIQAAKLASGAGLAGILSAGLGNSASYVKTDNGTKTLLAANATKDRGVLVIVTIDETFADGDNAQPVVEIGETDTIDKCFTHTKLVGATAGSVFCFGFLNTATKAIIATLTAAAGTGTGAFSVAVIALPNS